MEKFNQVKGISTTGKFYTDITNRIFLKVAQFTKERHYSHHWGKINLYHRFRNGVRMGKYAVVSTLQAKCKF